MSEIDRNDHEGDHAPVVTDESSGPRKDAEAVAGSAKENAKTAQRTERPLTAEEQADLEAFRAWARPRRYNKARHDNLIAGLVMEGAKAVGFRPVLRTATGIDCPALYPDAFKVDDEEQEVEVYEVEVTHLLTDEKLERYLRLCWDLDAIDWELRIVIVNRFGHRNELDLYDLLRELRAAS